MDAKHKLIVAQEVTNAGSDLGLLAPTAGAAKEVLGAARIDAVADKGYYKGEDIQACEETGIDAYVARPQRGSAVSNGLFRKEEFRYDAGSDTYLCPGEQRLEPRYRSVVNGHALVNYCNRQATSPLGGITNWDVDANNNVDKDIQTASDGQPVGTTDYGEVASSNQYCACGVNTNDPGVWTTITSVRGVPEPPTVSVLGAGLLGLGLFWWRRRRKLDLAQ